MNHRMYAEAIKLYESCLNGAWASDGSILFGLAKAAVEAGDWSRASGAITRLKADAPKMRPLEVRLLEARVHEGRGESDAALAVYRELLPVFVGLETRYRYGNLLLRLGKKEAAMEMFKEVVKHSGRFTSSVEGEERWALAAKRATAGS